LALTTEPHIGTFAYTDYSTIQTSGTYNIDQLGQNITMQASSYIVLKPNSYIKSGSKFLAKRAPCSIDSKTAQSASEESAAAKDEIDTEKLILFPNPSKSLVGISTKKDNFSSVVVKAIINGKVLFSKSMQPTNTYTIDVSAYLKGIYTVTAETPAGKILSGKLIKD
jgi:hypothetical protein